MRQLFGVLCLLMLFVGAGWNVASASESVESAETNPPLPAGFAIPEKIEDAKLLNRAWYARLADYANVYAEPSFSAPVIRNVGDGYLFASLQREVQAEGQTWYQINPNEYVLEADVSIARPSQFQGVQVLDQPQRWPCLQARHSQ